MARVVAVKVTWDNSKISLMNDRAVNGLFRLGFDIAAQARRNAPYLTGALRSTIRVQETSDKNTLQVVAGGVYGGKSVPYAWVREQGPNRNPATEHYMENAAKTVLAGDYMKKYFGNIL
ncbi:hypothetical protein [Fibrobacter sp.]|uniref:hypothetical protein n=1 Tax=Fibrobacter sp. TaxID=35828 RepID=UPI00388EFC3F